MAVASRVPIERREGERLGQTDGGFFDRISEFSEFRYGIAGKEHGHLAGACLHRRDACAPFLCIRIRCIDAENQMHF